jgi:hypothetical protein
VVHLEGALLGMAAVRKREEERERERERVAVHGEGGGEGEETSHFLEVETKCGTIVTRDKP